LVSSGESLHYTSQSSFILFKKLAGDALLTLRFYMLATCY
jgi:hypothetical protein